MKSIRLILLFSALYLLISNPLFSKEPERIEALLVIDSKSNLFQSVLHDEKTLLSTLEQIATNAKMKLTATIYNGSNVNQANINKWITSLKKNPHDVVLFYFSGHGCQETTTLIPWPRLFFSARGTLFPMKAIIQAIESTETRLSIIVSDCCNGPIAGKTLCLEQITTAHTGLRKSKSAIGAEKLFKQVKGHIRAVAAVRGQNALAFTRGSVFTLAFTKALGEAIMDNNPSWKAIFQSTKATCGHLQTPYFSLDLR